MRYKSDKGEYMYYFFGAGNNCHSAIGFWGKENICAIVDNDINKIGTELCGVPIIAFDEFLEKHNDEKVIITTNTGACAVSRQLEEAGINDYYICPYMQSGYYSSREIVTRWNLEQYDIITFYEKTPLSEKLMTEIGSEKVKVLFGEEENCITENTIKKVLIITEEYEEDNSEKWSCYQKVIDLNKDIERWHEEEFEYLKEYYKKHYGEKCFLIGNGPSLTAKDLDCIHKYKIHSLGCNGIYKMFSKTDWRPSYYFLADNIWLDREKESLPEGYHYFMRKMTKLVEEKTQDINLYCGKFENYFPGYPSFAIDIEKGVYGGRTIMYDMLQFAVYMGFSEIYLIGIDFSWGENGKNTHFCEGYSDGKREKFAMSYRPEIENAYYAAKRYADSHGIKIYNATRGGKLEVFERKNLDEVFKEIEAHEM